jgi:hypothetical protein
MLESFRGARKLFGGYSYCFEHRLNPILTTKITKDTKVSDI